MKCCLCEHIFNGNREPFFSGKPPICDKCGKSLVEHLFASDEFNRWLDGFMQSRLEIHVGTYNEYYRRYNVKKCPECDGRGCIRCNRIGTIEE